MRKNYPISMKIQGAHLQMVSNECANFQKNPCTHFLEHAWTKSCPQMGDRQTDRQAESNISPKLRLGGGGIIRPNNTLLLLILQDQLKDPTVLYYI